MRDNSYKWPGAMTKQIRVLSLNAVNVARSLRNYRRQSLTAASSFLRARGGEKKNEKERSEEKFDKIKKKELDILDCRSVATGGNFN